VRGPIIGKRLQGGTTQHLLAGRCRRTQLDAASHTDLESKSTILPLRLQEHRHGVVLSGDALDRERIAAAISKSHDLLGCNCERVLGHSRDPHMTYRE
jgi:hypothetical protein